MDFLTTTFLQNSQTSMKLKTHFSITLLVLTLFGTRTTQADLVLSVTPSAATYNAGDSGFLDVMIYSDAADALDSFLFGLNITGGAGAVFSAVQTEAFLTDPTYVFFNRSANVNQALPATNVGGGGSTISVADVSYDTGSLPLPGDPLPLVLPGIGAPLLLARVEFDAVSAGVFNVDIDPGSTFSDVGFNNFNFTSTGGSFTVNAAAVPEPASIMLACVTGLAAGAMRYRRRKAKSEKLKTNNIDEAT